MHGGGIPRYMHVLVLSTTQRIMETGILVLILYPRDIILFVHYPTQLADQH